MEDSRIVELYFDRSEQAIAETDRKYGPYCYSIAYNILTNQEDAQECVSDTYYAAWNRIPPHRPESYLYPFLARITRHLSLNCCRDRERLKRSAHLCEFSAEMEQCLPAPDDAACRLEENELREAINGFLAKLPEEQRNLFLRRYWYLDSIGDIARRFACSESKVKTTLLRCRKRLREHLEEGGYIL